MFRLRYLSPARILSGPAAPRFGDGDGSGDGNNNGSGDGNGNKKPEFDPTKFVDSDTFGRTAAKIRGIESQITELGKKALSLDTLAEVGLLVKGDDGKFTIKPAAPAKEPEPKPKPEDSPLAKEVEKLRKQLEQKEAEAKAASDKAALQSKADAIKTALGDAGAVKPGRDYVHLMGVVSQKEGGGFVVATKDKYDNEVETPLEDFVKKFLEENPELLKAQNQPGSGTPGQPQNGGPRTKTGARLISKSQWQDMGWYAKNAEKFKSGEFVRDYDH